jgi:alkylation response protein AidB-like acyl-CoA dehydrogenase
MTLEGTFRDLLAAGALELPPFGAGATPERLARLMEFGRADVSLARLVEAHVDAVEILSEAGRLPAAGSWYGVWAAEDPSTCLSLRTASGSRALLNGTKAVCTGAPLVDRALITVQTPETRLIDVDLRLHARRLDIDTSFWLTPAFADTGTASVTFDGIEIDDEAFVGPPGWYLDRPGFWNGACGPAACWAGGAMGLIDWAVNRAASGSANSHRDVTVGALSALGFQMVAILEHVGRGIDRDPNDTALAKVRALQSRQSIERACAEVLDRFGREFGPRPLALDAATHSRFLATQLYIRQCHAERDLEALGVALRANDRATNP